jgi:predicted AAA+ superfamily ATPase
MPARIATAYSLAMSASVMRDAAAKRRILISFDRERKTFKDSHGTIEVLPWQVFLEELWSNQLLS